MRKMKRVNIQKLSLAGILCAVAVAGSPFSIPFFAGRCAPVQHMVNILCAILLGPGYSLGVSFSASVIRNLLGLGSLMAFPGSMFGALVCSLTYWKSKKIFLTLAAEIFGTAILGGLCAYPVAILLMGQIAGELAFYSYIIPFFLSTMAGSLLAGFLVCTLKKFRVLVMMQRYLK